jgi:polyhydroxybutyrate depolymerase
MTQHSPDVEFLTKVLDDVAKAHPIDPKRVYVTGMSNGGMMSYRMAGTLSSRIAAAGIVSGAMFDDQPKPSQPVSMIIFHGTADPTVPFAGGMSTDARVAGSMDAPFWPVKKAFEYWVKEDGCKGEPRESVEGDVTKRDMESCRDHTAVVEYEIHGGVHTWPGGTRNPSPGPIDATDLIWSFFKTHPQH